MNTETKDKFAHARENAKGWLASIDDMLAELAKQDGDPNCDDARQAIEESVLSVQTRGGWHDPGICLDGLPEEYEILLTTGGPALRIFGRLDQHCQPESAELQMQDWGTRWERYPAPEATLLSFAACFWFGE